VGENTRIALLGMKLHRYNRRAGIKAFAHRFALSLQVHRYYQMLTFLRGRDMGNFYEAKVSDKREASF